ncbi:MAG TPA: 4-coumarate--CoA ligase family protein [Caldilinea sp.]|nr:4-coumarate--CoA ligase family protein [Caldilinea sp.]
MIYTSPFPAIEIPVQPLTNFLFDHAKEYPQKPALIDGPTGRTITFGQLAGAIRLAASGLAKRGFKKGDVFAIYLPNLPEYAVAFHAVATLGGINTTVNPLYTAHELAHQLTDSGASFVLTIPMFLDVAKAAAAEAGGIKEIFVLGEAEGATPFADLLKSDGQLPPVEIDPYEDLVVLPYSSGTTGLPKGVMLTHHNLVSNISQCENMQFGPGLELVSDDVVLGLLPFFHIYGMVVIMSWALRRGATVVTMPKFEMEMFLTTLQNHKITYSYLVPPIILGLAKHPVVDKFDLSALRVIVSGAAPLGADLEDAVRGRLGVRVAQGYGMTEASPVTHFISIEPEGKRKPGSIGVVIPNTECKVVDVATRAELGVKEDGELWVRGPQVMKGYLNNPQATANTVDTDGWLHTGDIGFADEDGYFWIVDRLKELIKYKGYQVAPAELEALLLTHHAVADAAVIGVPDEEAGEVPKAFVVLKGEATPEAIMAFVAEQVAPYKKIRAVEVIAQIPKSASGKILRRMLKDQEKLKG